MGVGISGSGLGLGAPGIGREQQGSRGNLEKVLREVSCAGGVCVCVCVVLKFQFPSTCAAYRIVCVNVYMHLQTGVRKVMHRSIRSSKRVSEMLS